MTVRGVSVGVAPWAWLRGRGSVGVAKGHHSLEELLHTETPSHCTPPHLQTLGRDTPMKQLSAVARLTHPDLHALESPWFILGVDVCTRTAPACERLGCTLVWGGRELGVAPQVSGADHAQPVPRSC
ncbi:uncharacterized protein LOC143490254 [Brachyhypopomus gauderio]|uniref:uncharacterized protein LOC143490254 n=1 Tax=Brachyhypopomus gauderio TaxID=698409 RepID=UPI0040413F13